jgi:microcystin-dependent protein
MSQPYIGEIRMFGGNFPPAGWAFCDGQPMAISENDALFTIIGTTYGGDGEETFNLPNLQSRIPMHQGTLGGTTFQLGEAAGTEQVTLTVQQIPAHNHPATCKGGENTGNSATPANNVSASQSSFGLYTSTFTPVQMNVNAAQPAGGSQPHENMVPFLCINFILSLFGLLPHQ